MSTVLRRGARTRICGTRRDSDSALELAFSSAAFSRDGAVGAAGGGGGCGWGCGCFGHGLFVNTGFFNRYGFHGGFGGRFGGGGFGDRMAWAHDSGHRMGGPYSSPAVASPFHSTLFNGNARCNGGSRFNTSARSSGGGFGGNRATNGYAGSYRQASPNYGARSTSQGYRASAQSSSAQS